MTKRHWRFIHMAFGETRLLYVISTSATHSTPTFFFFYRCIMSMHSYAFLIFTTIFAHAQNKHEYCYVQLKVPGNTVGGGLQSG